MAVNSTGERVGYITSGCLEEAVTRDALSAIHDKTSKVVKYGKNSQYLDFRLPCGGSLTLYIHVKPDLALITRCVHFLRSREPFTLAYNSALGTIAFSDDMELGFGSRNRGGVLTRTYQPSPRFVLIGTGAELETMARVTSAAGYETDVFTPDLDLEDNCAASGVSFYHLKNAHVPPPLPNDSWTAFVFLFHDHDHEPTLIKSALTGPAFYIGALGSKKAHAERLHRLRELGIEETSLTRIHGPMGLIPSARDPAILAISTIAEVIECFQQTTASLQYTRAM